jgi:hypothetical protein
MDGVIVTNSALSVSHFRVAVWPGVIVLGEASKVIVGSTRLVTTFLGVPPGPLAIRLYSSVGDGTTRITPDIGVVAFGADGEIVTGVALLVCHSIDCPPPARSGEAAKATLAESKESVFCLWPNAIRMNTEIIKSVRAMQNRKRKSI